MTLLSVPFAPVLARNKMPFRKKSNGIVLTIVTQFSNIATSTHLLLLLLYWNSVTIMNVTYCCDLSRQWLNQLAADPSYQLVRVLAPGEPTGQISLAFSTNDGSCEFRLASTQYGWNVHGNPQGITIFVGRLYRRENDGTVCFDVRITAGENNSEDETTKYSYRVAVRDGLMVSARDDLVGKLRIARAVVKEFDFLEKVNVSTLGDIGDFKQATVRTYISDPTDGTYKFHVESMDGNTIYLANASGLCIHVRNRTAVKVILAVADNLPQQVEIVSPAVTFVGLVFDEAVDFPGVIQAFRAAGIVETGM